MKKLTWGNAGRSASERFPSDPRTHISPIIVHRALFFEKKGGGKAGWWKDGVLDVGESTRFSRVRDDFGDTPDVPRDDEPSARGFGDASDASQTKMPRTLFLRRKSVGKRRARGVALPLYGVLLQVVGVILFEISIEQSHGVSHAWLLVNVLGVKKPHVAHRFWGREGHEGKTVGRHGGIFERKVITERVQESHRVVARMDEADEHARTCDAHSHILQRIIAKQPLDLLRRFS